MIGTSVMKELRYDEKSTMNKTSYKKFEKKKEWNIYSIRKKEFPCDFQRMQSQSSIHIFLKYYFQAE